MRKYVATILLDPNDRYVDAEGNLPKRPRWDKKLLAALVAGETVSHKGYKLLPPSIRETVEVSHMIEPYPITIEEIDALADILIVSRSPEPLRNGKTFRLNNFVLIMLSKDIEIWKRKTL